MNGRSKTEALAYLALLALVSTPVAKNSFADETVPEKAANSVDEAKKDMSKSARNVKKKVRDATGNSSLKKDAGDAAENVGDEVKTEAKKLKRKAD